MDKNAALEQVKQAYGLYREGEELLKSALAAPIGEEKIQEALNLVLDAIKSVPDIREAYSLASQIYLRKGDRQNFLVCQKKYQELKKA